MSVVDDLRKVLQDMIAPDLGVLKEGMQHLKEGQQQIRADFKDLQSSALATETRLLRSIGAAKAEVLLTMRVSRQEERIAELTADLARARGSHATPPPPEQSAHQCQ